MTSAEASSEIATALQERTETLEICIRARNNAAFVSFAAALAALDSGDKAQARDLLYGSMSATYMDRRWLAESPIQITREDAQGMLGEVEGILTSFMGRVLP